MSIRNVLIMGNFKREFLSKEFQEIFEAKSRYHTRDEKLIKGIG
jgi:hypothetical protein